MSTVWHETFKGIDASVYRLNKDKHIWEQIGLNGQIYILYDNANKNDVRIRWCKTSSAIQWKITIPKIQPKGDTFRSSGCVIKVYRVESTAAGEIIAVRFRDPNVANNFYIQFKIVTSNMTMTFQQRTTQISTPQLPPHPNDMRFHFANHNNFVSELPMTKWECAQCTSQNDIIELSCRICHLSQIESQHRIISPKQKVIQTNEWHDTNRWQCSFCTLFNDKTADRCEACGAKPRYTQNINYNVDMGPIPKFRCKYWRCVLCTNNNVVSSDICEQCGVSKAYMEPDSNSIESIVAPNYYSNMDTNNCRFEETENKMMTPDRNENGDVITTEDEFRNAVSYIAINCDNTYVLKTLFDLLNELVTKDDIRYTTLDTTLDMERLIGYEGVLDFLLLIGWESDLLGHKLFCFKKPKLNVVRNAMNAINLYLLKFDHALTQINDYKCIFGQDTNQDTVNGRLHQHDELLVFGYIHRYHNQMPRALIEFCILFYHEHVFKIEGLNYFNMGFPIQSVIKWAVLHTEMEHDTMKTIVVSHKLFMKSLDLFKCLKNVFIQTKENIQLVRYNIKKCLKMWLSVYWKQDFMNNHELKKELKLWVKQNRFSDVLNEYERLNSLQVSEQNKHNLLTLIEDKQRQKKQILVYGYLRENQRENILRLPALMLIFSMFYEFDTSEFNISNFNAEEIADQITLIDAYLFSQIEQRELLTKNWNYQKDNEYTNILNMIQNANHFSTFVQVTILKEKSDAQRVNFIEQLIKIGQRLRKLNNFHSLCAILNALHSIARNQWSKIPKESIDSYNKINSTFKRDFGFYRNYKRSIHIQQSTKHPVIPHIGFSLQDIAAIDEATLTCSNQHTRFSNGINFNQYVKLVEATNRIQSYQISMELYQNNIQEHLPLQRMLLSEFEKVKNTTQRDDLLELSQ
eukprot:449220_1